MYDTFHFKLMHAQKCSRNQVITKYVSHCNYVFTTSSTMIHFGNGYEIDTALTKFHEKAKTQYKAICR